MTIETKMCRNICVDNWDNAENKYIPQNLEWGTLMQIVPIRFCHVSKFQAPDCSKHQHVGTKRSVLWLSKYAKIRFRPGLYPGPSWRKLTTLSRPVSRLGRWHLTPYSAFAARHASPRIPAISTPMLEGLLFCRCPIFFTGPLISQHV